MQKFKLLSTIFIISFLTLYTGCDYNIKTLEKDFNTAFTKIDISQSDSEPDDEDFDEKLMLDEKYYVKVSGNTGMLQISAPKSNSYKWSLFDPIEKKDASPKIPSVSLTERYFVIEYSSSYLEKGKTYLINLVVTDKEGNRYSDSAQLIFCQWYDINTVDNLVTEITSEEEKKASADDSEEENSSDEQLVADDTSTDKSEEETKTSTDSSEEFKDETSEPRTSEDSL